MGNKKARRRNAGGPFDMAFDPKGGLADWVQGGDSNPRPSDYESDALPGCATPLGPSYGGPEGWVSRKDVLAASTLAQPSLAQSG